MIIRICVRFTHVYIFQRNNKCSFLMKIVSNTGRFIMFSVITSIYNKKTKGPTLTELFTATGKLKEVFF